MEGTAIKTVLLYAVTGSALFAVAFSLSDRLNDALTALSLIGATLH